MSPTKNLTGYSLSPKQDKILITTRGVLAIAPNWEGPVIKIGECQGVRHKLANWLGNTSKIIAVNDSDGEERIILYDSENIKNYKKFKQIGSGGYIQQLTPSPEGTLAAVAVSNCLHILSLNDDTSKKIDQAGNRYFREFSWSPDGRWLAYAKFESEYNYSSIYIYDTQTEKITRVTHEEVHDYSPCFDPKGRYLYFLSKRVFNPYEDSLQNDYNFPATARPYLLVLQASQYSPFTSAGSLDLDDDDNEDNNSKIKKKKKKKEKENIKVEIDLDGIINRIQAIPIKEGRYFKLSAADDKIFVLKEPLQGVLTEVHIFDPGKQAKYTLLSYDLKTRKETIITRRLTSFSHNFP